MNFDKPTLVTLTAPTCSGKSYLLAALRSIGFNAIVGTTTRAPRPGEVEGIDYYFISREESLRLEENCEFAELAEFRGNRYGVTHDEMTKKLMSREFPPIVILEPSGLEAYEKYCVKHDLGIFKVFVTVSEKTKIDRLVQRTASDLLEADDEDTITRIVKIHTDRLMSITGDERAWQTRNTWNAIVPGDNLQKAIEMIKKGIECQNARTAELAQNM